MKQYEAPNLLLSHIHRVLHKIIQVNLSKLSVLPVGYFHIPVMKCYQCTCPDQETITRSVLGDQTDIPPAVLEVGKPGAGTIPCYSVLGEIQTQRGPHTVYW